MSQKFELRLYRKYGWTPYNPTGRIGGKLDYILDHIDILQYKTDETSDWVNVKLVEGEKPPNPNDVKIANELKELEKNLDEAIKKGIVKLP